MMLGIPRCDETPVATALWTLTHNGANPCGDAIDRVRFSASLVQSGAKADVMNAVATAGERV